MGDYAREVQIRNCVDYYCKSKGLKYTDDEMKQLRYMTDRYLAINKIDISNSINITNALRDQEKVFKVAKEIYGDDFSAWKKECYA